MIWRVVERTVYYTFLRCERESELRWEAQGEREPVSERQRLECRESSSHRGPETHYFLSLVWVRVFVCNPFFHPPSCRPISSSFWSSTAYFSCEM